MKFSHVLATTLAVAALAFIGCEQATDAEPVISHPDATVYGTVGGYVKDSFGIPLPNVTVSANTGSNSRDIVHAVTDSNGWFEIKNLISGDHTLIVGTSAVGATVRTTTCTVLVHVPEMDELRNASELPAQGYSAREIVQYPASMIKEVDGNYFVNIDIGDSFTVYPFTATLTGTAMLKTSSLDPDTDAVVPGTGYTIQADFAAWNEGETLIFSGTVDGTTGAFTIANVPAIADSSITTSSKIMLRIHNSVVVADATSNLSSSTDSNIGDGVLIGSRSVGSIYFVQSITPVIIDFSPEPSSYSVEEFAPGTTAAPTPLVFTFSKAMNPALGVLGLMDSGSDPYAFAAAWSAVNTVYTVTPADPFEFGETITATFTGFESADDIPFAGGPFNFVVRDAVDVVETSWQGAYAVTDPERVAIAASPTITFNNTLVSFDPETTYLSQGSLRVEAVFTVAGAVLTVNPAADLANNTIYTVTYTVSDGITEITSSETFTTVFAAAATAPTLALDLVIKPEYEYGTNVTVPVSFTKGATGTTYKAQYRLAADANWSAPAALTVSSYNTLFEFATVTMTGAFVSGKTASVRIYAYANGAEVGTVSNAVSVTDTTAPTAVTVAGVAVVPSATPSTVEVIVPTVVTPATASAAGKISFTVLLTGAAEEIALPTFTGNTTTVMTFDTGRYDAAARTWTVYFNVLAGQDYTTQNAIEMTVTDAAGNAYDHDSAAATTANVTLDFN